MSGVRFGHWGAVMGRVLLTERGTPSRWLNKASFPFPLERVWLAHRPVAWRHGLCDWLAMTKRACGHSRVYASSRLSVSDRHEWRLWRLGLGSDRNVETTSHRLYRRNMLDLGHRCVFHYRVSRSERTVAWSLGALLRTCRAGHWGLGPRLAARLLRVGFLCNQLPFLVVSLLASVIVFNLYRVSVVV